MQPIDMLRLAIAFAVLPFLGFAYFGVYGLAGGLIIGAVWYVDDRHKEDTSG